MDLYAEEKKDVQLCSRPGNLTCSLTFPQCVELQQSLTLGYIVTYKVAGSSKSALTTTWHASISRIYRRHCYSLTHLSSVMGRN